jgi:hypothetical protein
VSGNAGDSNILDLPEVSLVEAQVLSMKKHVWRAVVEVACILFLFYANLLMGEFERSGLGRKNGLAWALGDVLTASNFEIAMVAATIGYLFFEFLRRRF